MKQQIILLILFFPIMVFGQFKSSIDVVGGIDYSYRYLQDDSRSSFSISESRANEKAIINHRFGININCQIKPNIYFKTGLRFVKSGYKNTIEGLIFATSFIDGSIDPEINGQDLKTVITHSFFEVPVMARYEFRNKRFTPYFEIGLSPNFYLTTKRAQFLDDEVFSDAVSEKVENASDIQIVGSLSFGVNYQLSKFCQLFAQPIVRYHLTNFRKEKAEEHLYNFGLEIGIRGGLK